MKTYAMQQAARLKKAKHRKNRVRDSIVLDFGSHIEFPDARTLTGVPAGIYYPGFNRQTDTFQLRKLNSHENDGVEDGQAMLDEIQDMLKDDSENAEKIQRYLLMSKTNYLERGYFDMTPHHKNLMHAEKNINAFLDGQEFFNSMNLAYKRGLLLYGDPGTGKSRYIDQLSRRLIEEKEAIVVRIEDGDALTNVAEKGLLMIERTMKDRLKVFVIEELAALCDHRGNVVTLLNFLDNALLRDNVLFLMTTNNPERIPSNIIDRPSRVDVLVEVNSEGFSDSFIPAWYEHLLGEPMPNDLRFEDWYEAKLSPAYLKEMFLYSRLHSVPVYDSWLRIEDRRNVIRAKFMEQNQIGF